MKKIYKIINYMMLFSLFTQVVNPTLVVAMEQGNAISSQIESTAETDAENTIIESSKEVQELPLIDSSSAEAHSSQSSLSSSSVQEPASSQQPVGTQPASESETANSNSSIDSSPTAESPSTDSNSNVESSSSDTKTRTKRDVSATLLATQMALVKSNDSSKDPQLTTFSHTGRISIDGTGTTGVLSNAYLEITIDSTYLSRIDVPTTATIVKRTTQVDNGNGTRTVRVYLNDIDATTTASFTFSLRFLNRMTPNGYATNPEVTLFKQDGTKIESATGSFNFAVKTVTPNIYKYVVSNESTNFSNDGQIVYGGGSDPAKTYIANASDVTFMYRMENKLGRNTLSYGDGLSSVRLYEKIVLTDVLPTYINNQNQRVTAVFSAAKNPGWVDNGDGTVSKIVNSQSTDLITGGADTAVSDEKLVLSFPGAQLKDTFTNSVSADLTPYNKANYEMIAKVSDPINFKLSADIFPGSGYFIKNSNTRTQVILDPGFNHTVYDQYALVLTNKTSYPMKNIVITDGPFDSRFYLAGLNYQGSLGNQIKVIYGIKADGTKEAISFTPSANGNVNIPMIDTATRNQVLSIVNQVESGQISEENAPKAQTTYTGLEIALKDEFVLQPGQSFNFLLSLMFNDPYHTKVIQPTNSEANTYRNAAKASGNLVMGDQNMNFSFDSNSFSRATQKAESMSVSKFTYSNPTGALGEQVEYRISFDTRNLAQGRRFTNAKLIDVLPEGVTYLRTYPTGQALLDRGFKSVEVIENFNNTGRQAVVFSFADELVREITLKNTNSISISGVINANAIPVNAVSPEHNNINRVYFTADNLKTIPSEITVSSLLPDIFDVDNDGDKADMVIGSQSDTIANLPTEIRSVKFIRNVNGAWSRTGIFTKYDEDFEYRLETENYSGGDMNNLIVYDRLPYSGDTNGSHFSNKLRGPLVVPSGYTAYYRTDTPSDDVNTAVAENSWQTSVTDYSKVTAIKVVMNPGTILKRGNIVYFDVPMKAASYAGGVLETKVAINHFYSSRDSGVTFGETNAVYNQMPQNIPVTKKWVGTPLPSIEVGVYRQSVPNTILQRLTLNQANNYSALFMNLPAADKNGVVITDYKVKELTTNIQNFDKQYAVSITGDADRGYVITNTEKLKTVEGEKIWDDADNQDGKRPSSIKLYLLADGKRIQEQEVTQASNWQFVFENLPIYSNGREIQYSLEEEKVTGYTTTIEGSLITNTYTPETVNLSGAKVWDDANNQDGKQPESITVHLLADGEKVDELEVRADTDWKFTFSAFPKYKEGKEISYTFTEEAVDGYTSKVDGDIITNSYTPELTSVAVEKIWNDANNQDGKRPESIVVNLLADDVKVSSQTVTADSQWKYTFTGLPKYQAGKEISYTVTEEAVENYTSQIQGTTITNSYTPETINLPVQKIWDDADNQDGKRPASIEVHLFADGTKVSSQTITVDNQWKYTFDNLPKYKAGKEITYTLSEEPVESYLTSINGGNITNSHRPETIDVSGTKVWNDANNQDGKRPESITVNLLADGQKIGSREVKADSEWLFTFSELPKYKEGKEIVYSISEEVVENYTSDIQGTTITNSYTPQVTTVSGQKIWNDVNNQDGKRPESIVVNLLADGNKIDTATVKVDSDWKFVFNNLPQYKDGKEISYTVTEDAVENYSVEVNGTIITNSYTPEVTSISGKKVWDDANNQDGKRPATIKVNLLADGQKVSTQDVTADSNWEFMFNNLSKYKDGKEIVYTITEEAVEHYTSQIQGTTIINSYTPEVTSVSVEKIWNDANNQDGKRPASITVNLLADDVKVSSQSITADSQWKYTFADLAKYKDGKEIIYTITEEAVEHYTSQIQGTTIINSYTPELTSVSVEKIWDDANNQDGKRPESIIVNLLADGTKVLDQTIKADSEWKFTFTNLPKFKEGKEISYTVTEEAVENYTTDVQGTTITNSYTPEVTSVSGEKVWNDANNQDGKRPASIEVNLLADGQKVANQTVKADSEWKFTFANLPKYKDGKEIVYTISEDTVENYISQIQGTTITNSYTPETTSVSIEKVWDDANNQDGKRPESIVVNLVADGTQLLSETVKADSGWQHTFANLPKYKTGKEIVYTISEEAVENYSTNIKGNTITNSYTPEVTSIAGEKIWDDADNQDGKRPASITVNLMADGNKVSSQTVNADSEWKFTFVDQPKFKAGKEIVYSLTEDAVDEYVTVINGTTITNSYVPEMTSLSGQKIWDDADNQDGKRPASITVNLLADGKEVAEVSVTADNNWKFAFTDLPKYKEGKEIVYSLSEDEVDLYLSSINGTTITNAHLPEITSVSGEKVWDDVNNQDGKRPESVIVNLLADGTSIGNQTVKADSGWKFNFSDLPKFKDGKEIVYTISEEAVEHYTSQIQGTTITNSYTPETTRLTGEKTWNDANNQDGKRPESIVVNLLANGQKVNKQTVKADSEWKFTFTDLPKFKDGQEIVYTLSEEAVENYTTEIQGTTITNSYTPETTSVSGEKVWNDADNQDGKRPESIVVNVLADGIKVASQTVGADIDWKFIFNNLPKYKDGKEIIYTVSEDVVENYSMEIKGTTIINTHNLEITHINGVKIWNDANNQDGKRPESVVVNLLADGQKVTSQTVNVDSEWKFTFANLPKFKDGKEIVYTVSEEAVDKYTTKIQGTTITNSYTPETTSISGEKVWKDANNQDGKRPETIVVTLLADGTKVSDQAVNADSEWKFTFADLPKFKDGKEIVYTISEEAVDNYTTEIQGTTITNSYTPETTSVSGEKVWDDANNQDGKRPESIVVNLLADGQKVNNQTVKADSEWKFSFTDLPKFKEGKEIAYTISEEVVENYTTKIKGTTITNSYTPETTNVSGEKVWNDANNQDGKRPETIVVTLLADGQKVDSQTVKVDTEWKFSFTNLPKYKAGKEISYTLAEETVENYTTEIQGTSITNSYTPETTNVSGEKVWNDADNQDGKRPDTIKVNLLADGQKVSDQTVKADTEWKFSFTDLPKFKEGKEIAYTISEEVVENYTTEIKGTTITNSYTPEMTNISGEKVWNDANNQDGKRPESVMVNLLADGKKVQEMSVKADTEWKFNFTSLPKYKEGKEISYTISEQAVGNYTSEIQGNKVINTYNPEITHINGVKIWNDVNNQDGKRPESIIVNLLADGQKVDSQTVKVDTEWKFTFANLPKYRAGKEIVYTISEEVVENYTTEIQGTTITNSYTPETTNVLGEKVWNDADNQDGKRPSSIVVNLLANGKQVENQTVKADSNWKFSFTNLPKYKDGKEISYTITEENVEKYTTEIQGTTITNSYIPETTSVSGEKVWDDADNQDGKRPESIVVNLLADGQKVVNQTVKADTEWKFTFADLPKFKEGKEIVYTISEEVVENYTTEIQGTIITNSYTPETTSLSGEKVWNDADNQDGKRPESIVVNLLADGQKVANQTVKADTEWKFTFTALAKYKDGKEIIYTISEEVVESYFSDIQGNKIINTYNPEITHMSGDKVWNDANNQDGKRPESIIVNLLADGQKVTSQTVKDDTGWNFSFTNLPKYKNGKEISYTVTEEVVENYITEIQGTSIINSYKPETTTLSGEKIWNDANNQDGKRPETIKVNLLADGKKMQEVSVTADTEWKFTFKNLPKYKEGKEISYSISEDAVANYASEIQGNKIINTYNPQITHVTGSKVWKDADNQDGKRPESIVVNLLANGQKVANKTIETDTDWKFSFNNLPKFNEGKEISYTVTEEAVENYSTEIQGTTITNSYIPETTNVSGEKVWKDADNQDGKRPESIVVNLLADGQKVTSQTVKDDAGWNFTFANLPKYKAGKEIVYTISEEAVDNYTTEIQGTTITNSYTPETTSVSGEKVWNDVNNQDGKRPEEIVVNLLADGIKVSEQTVKVDTEWKFTFADLPKYKSGKEISYTVTEEAVDNYSSEIQGNKIINTYNPEITHISGNKVWNDADNQDSKRPESIVVNLLADGQKIISQTVKADVEWKFTFTNLPKFKDGKEIIYTVSEEEVENYTTEIQGTTITNSYTPEITSLTGEKVWDDADNQDGKRPDTIKVNLLVDGQKIANQTVKADTEWKFSFTDLPKFKDGKEIVYTISEEAVENYTSEIQGTTITNSYTPETTNISGEKVWNDANNQDGKRPKSIAVNLLANGKQVDNRTVTADSEWKFSFTNLPKYKAGKEISYTLAEETVENYTTEIQGTTITNSYTPETTSVSGEKVWEDADNQDGKRPESIVVDLLADGQKVANQTVKADTEWKFTFTNLPKYKAGKEIVYTISEKTVEYYSSKVRGTVITNTYNPAITHVSGNKVWDDADNQDGKRPESIVVNLLADGKKVGKQTVTADTEWEFSFINLPKFKAGKEIVYTISEETVENYTSEIQGTTITNSYIPETTSLSGEKVWDDANNQDGKRPESIVVGVMADGQKVANQTVKADTEWKFTFTDLPKYKAGKEIVYTISEEAVAGYTSEIQGNKITNTYNPDITHVAGNKVWNDTDNQDGKRPTSITVNLLANGQKVNEQTVEVNTDWTFSFNNLPKFKDGKEISYTVTEEAVENYTTEIQGTTITNSYTPETTNVSGEKVWNDADNQDGKRPELITVNLLANGTKVSDKTVTDDTNWKFSFDNLPKYKDGKEISYTVTEEVVENYTTEIQGTTIINTYNPEITHVSGYKIWDDANNKSGKRPESIVVELLADGEKISQQTVREASDWSFVFANLPKFKEGKEISYQIREVAVSGYESKVDGFTITNILKKDSGEPSKPVTPVTPTKPEKPVPTKPEKVKPTPTTKKQLPKTGTNSNTELQIAALAFVLLGVGLVLPTKKREIKKKAS